MRRLLAAILSTAIALEPVAASAQMKPYVRFLPETGTSAITVPTATTITGPNSVHGHVYSLVQAKYAVSSGLAATFTATGLPDGLTMAADGTLRGAPYAPFSGTVEVAAALQDGTHQTLALDVEIADIMQVVGTNDQAGHVNVAMTIPAAQVINSPVLPITWALATGTVLPQGLGLNADGTISGTPTEPGNFNAKLLATDANGDTALSQSFGIAIADGIHVAAVPDIVAHVGSAIIAETGSASGAIQSALAWSVSPALPAGLSVSSDKGMISGTPTAAATQGSYVLSAVDSTGIPGPSPAFHVTVYGPVGVATVAPMRMHTGQAYTSPAFVAQNQPTAPYTWRLTNGTSLPGGLSVDPTAGTVTGTATSTGSSTVTVDLVDAQGGVFTSAPFTVSAVDPLAIGQVADQSAPSGTPLTVAPNLTGTPIGTVKWTVEGEGDGYGVNATQNQATGAVTFSSTLGTSGTYRLVATDDTGPSQSNTFAVSFAAPFTVTGNDPVTYRQGDRAALAAPTVAANPKATGGGAVPASLSWSLPNGALPDGLTLNPDGTITGLLQSDAKSTTVPVLATDPNGVGVVSKPLEAITVLPPLSIAAASVTAHVGDSATAAPKVDSTAAQPVKWTILSGTLPDGLTLDPDTGVISGTPTTTTGQSGALERPAGLGLMDHFAGLFVGAAHAATTSTSVTLQARDNKGYTATTVVPITIVPAMTVTTPADGSDRVGDIVNFQPTLKNVIGQATWSLKQGYTLPSWLVLDTATGNLHGVAADVYKGAITLHVVDSTGAALDTAAFNLAVGPQLAIANFPAQVYAAAGAPFASKTPTVQNSPVGTVTWSIESHYGNGISIQTPSWIKVDPATGVVSGQTSAFATAGYLYLHAKDANGTEATPFQFSIVVNSAFALGDMPSITVRQGDYVSAAGPSTGTGGVSPFQFSMASGGLPSGMALEQATGRIYGTPTTTAGSPFDDLMQALDSKGQVGISQNGFRVTVSPLLQVAGTADDTTYLGGPIATPALTVSNGPVGTVAWSLGAGTLPPGAKVNGDGSLSGTASAVGSTTLSLVATDASANKDSATSAPFTVKVQPAMTVTTPANMSFRLGVPQGIAGPVVGNAIGSPIYALVGTMPGNLGIDATLGNLGGTATATGTGKVQVKVTDSVGQSASTNQFNVTVLSALALAKVADVNAHAGSSLAIAAPAASPSPVLPETWTVGTSTLPAPALLNADGSITAGALAAASAGDYPVTLKVTDNVGAQASTTFTIHVRGALSMDPAAAQTVAMNTAAAIAAPAVHGNPDLPVWSLASGTLPRGLSVRSADGAIVGTSTQSGTFPVTIGFTDSSGAKLSTNAFNVIVPALQASQGDETVGYNTPDTHPAPTVTGNPAATLLWALTTGTPPRGLSFRTDGTFIGTASQTGTFPIAMTVTDANGETAKASFNIIVPVLVGTLADQTVPLNTYTTIPAPSVPSAKAPLSWALKGGTAAPAGMALAINGTVSGTLTAPGTSPVSLVLTDANGETAPITYNVIAPALTVEPVADQTVALNTATTIPAPTVDGTPKTPVTWTLASGTLPTGLKVNADGTVTGTVTTASGVSTVVLAYRDANGLTGQTNAFKVTVPGLTVETVADAPLVMNTPATLPAPVIDGNPEATISWTLAVGALPSGLRVNADGTVTGTPTVSGSFPVALAFRDANGLTGQTNVFAISMPGLTLHAPVAEQDIALNTPVTIPTPSIDGNPATTNQAWTIASGALPLGMALHASTGLIDGAAKHSGTYNASLKLVDGNGQTVTTNVFSIVVDGLAVAGVPTVQVARAGLASPPSALLLHQSDAGYAFPAPAITGTAATPVAWTAVSGGLPPGLAYDATSNTFKGSVTSAGSYSLALKVTDANGETATSPSFTLQVLPPLTLATAGNVTLYTDRVKSVSAPGLYGSPQSPVAWTETGSLPASTAFSASLGSISGQPTATGTFPLTLTARDATGASVTTASFNLVVQPALTVAAPTTIAKIHASAPSVPVNGTAAMVSYGVAPYSYALYSGTAPTGMTVDPNTGLLTGSTGTQATYPAKFTISEIVTDADGKTAYTQPYEVDVVAPMTVTTPSAATVHAGTAVAAIGPVVSNGSGTITYAFDASFTPPTGMTVASATGIVSTTTTTPSGSYGVVLRGTDPTGAYAATNAFTVTVYAPLDFTGPSAKLVLRNGVTYAGTTLGTWTSANVIGTGTFAEATVPGLGFTGSVLAGKPTSTTSVTGGSLAVTLTDGPTYPASSVVSHSFNYDYYGSALGLTANGGGTYPTAVPLAIPSPTVSGTPVNAKFSLSAALPAGLALNVDGTITGTATAAASVAETMTVTDDTGGTATASFTLITQAATTADATYPTTITNSSGTNPSIAAMYDQSQATTTVLPAGGTLTFAYAGPVTANGMSSTATSTTVSGLVLKYNSGSASTITWTNVAGAANPTSTLFQVTNTGAAAVTLPDLFLSYGGRIAAYLPSESPAALTMTSGTAYTSDLGTVMSALNVSGSSTWTLATGSDSLPTGLSVSGSTLSGTPSTFGAYNLLFKVTDSRGIASVPQALTLTVQGMLASTTYPSSATSTGTNTSMPSLYDASSTTLVGVGGNTVYYISLVYPQPVATDGSVDTDMSSATLQYLPSGSSTWATVSGTVTATQFRLLNSGGANQNVSRFRLGYGGKYPAYLPSTTTYTVPTTAAANANGTSKTYDLHTLMAPLNLDASGTETWTIASNGNSSCAGASVSGTTLTVSYGCTIPGGNQGSATLGMTVTDSRGIASTSANFIAYFYNPPTLSNATVSAQQYQGVGYTLSTTMSLAGNSTSSTWTGTNIPTGLSLSTAGVLSGVPGTTGTYTPTITATNSNGVSATATLTINVTGGTTTADTTYPLSATNNGTSVSVPSLYDASSTTLVFMGGNSGYYISLVYPQPVATDGSVDTDMSGATLQYLPSGSSTWTTVSGTVAATQFRLLNSGGASQNVSRFRLGYGGKYPASLPSTTAYTVPTTAPAPMGSSTTYDLHALMAPLNLDASGTETWTVSTTNTSVNTSISGTKLTASYNGTYNSTGTLAFAIQVTVTDSRGIASTPVSYTFAFAQPPTLSNASTTLTLNKAMTNQGLATTMSATLLNGPTWSSTVMPAGLTLNGATLSGTPTTAGTYPVTVTVKNSTGLSATATLTITVQ